MKTLSGTFKVDEVNGVQVNQKFPFEYREFETLDEVKSSADWTDKNLLELVNSHEKAAASANEYQKVTKPYRPDTSTPEYKRESLIKNLVNTFGVARDVAEQQIDALIAMGTVKLEETPA